MSYPVAMEILRLIDESIDPTIIRLKERNLGNKFEVGYTIVTPEGDLPRRSSQNEPPNPGGLSRCPRCPYMQYSSLAADRVRQPQGGLRWQGHDL
jgi:hypothetical protein